VSFVRLLSGVLLAVCAVFTFAQTVSPVIVEYKVKADGRFALTNNTLTPMAVTLEPRSFSITSDGNGAYRTLDAGIHVQLSAMSARIDPGQTYYVFYKAKADRLPAWFTIYSTFSSLQHTGSLDVRILLPHTVYIYPKNQASNDVVKVTQATFAASSNKVICELLNNSADLERVQEIRVISKTKSATAAGFPMLPGGQRHVEVPWNESEPPTGIQFRLEHSTMNLPLATAGS
jgi:hypothetical protein